MFPILWTLDPLSLGFNFYSLPPFSSLLSRVPLHHKLPPRASFSSGSSHSSFVVDLPALFTMHAATMLPRPRPRLWDEVVHNATAIRSCAPASGRSPLTIISSLFLIFSSFFFYSVLIERGSSIRTDSFGPLVCGTVDYANRRRGEAR